jgi:hypothetical protein
LSPTRRQSFDSDDLKKPGWLPTSIVVNILGRSDTRRGRRVSQKDLIEIRETKDTRAELVLPKQYTGPSWQPTNLAPLEVIDGQHRLFAFGPDALDGSFELPVVAFHGLDIGWQAYLFWSINVSPKKINPSHAFDLYPLLRSQDWLDKFAESNVYREARAQELTEILFRHPKSPWANRINMLGEQGKGGVTQAGWIRSLASTFLAAGRGGGAKGLFGCSISSTGGPLPWTRAQQGAFLIRLWDECRLAVENLSSIWTQALRQTDAQLELPNARIDLAFAGPHTMLNQEQGIRGLMSVANDLFFTSADRLRLASWESSEDSGENTGNEDITAALRSLSRQKFLSFVTQFAEAIADYDWRSASAPELDDREILVRRAFRGSGGYAALRNELLKSLSKGKGVVAKGAGDLLKK